MINTIEYNPNIFVGGANRTTYRGGAWDVRNYQVLVSSLLKQIEDSQAGRALFRHIVKRVLILPVQDWHNGDDLGGLARSVHNIDNLDLVVNQVTQNVASNFENSPGDNNAFWDAGGSKNRTGSEVTIFFTPDFYFKNARLSQSFAGEFRPDCMLFHELVHASRATRGVADSREPSGPLPIGDLQRYDTNDEFFAILLTNIYRSEKHKTTRLRASHRTDFHHYEHPDGFLDVPEFVRLMDTQFQQSKALMYDFGRVKADWNPVSGYLLQKAIANFKR